MNPIIMSEETNGILEELLALEQEEKHDLPTKVTNRLLLVAIIANRKSVLNEIKAGDQRRKDMTTMDKDIGRLKDLVYKVFLPVIVALVIAAVSQLLPVAP